MRALLDVNVLIALFDEDHVFNERAHVWLEAHGDAGIATCPLTENAVVRILANPGYSKTLRLTPADVIGVLGDFLASQNHAFWPDSLSVCSIKAFDARRILGSRQLTDIYLLGLAVANRGTLATFDDRIARSAVHGAKPAHLTVI